jgi:predicted DNA-binding protein (MmcQ/YjbR family)
MNIEELREYCLSLKNVTEDIKWGNDLCFCIGKKMFCVVPLSGNLSVTFKVTPEEFDELSVRDGFKPAAYLARAKWVTLTDVSFVTKKELKGYINQSYGIIGAKLPKKKTK